MREDRPLDHLDHIGHVEVDLDDAEPSGPPVARWSRPLVALALVIVLGTLVAGLVVRSGDPDDAADVTTTAPDVTATTVEVEVPTVAQLLAQMPAGPLDGKASWKLPVLAQPQSEVVDGQIVSVLGKGFLPGEQVGIVMCTSEAGAEGVAACDLGVDGGFQHVTYADADGAGVVVAQVAVRQFVTTPFSGPVDCRSGPERCIVAIGAVSDYDRSGGTTIGFTGQPPFPEPSVVVEPPGPYEPGQTVAVRASSMMPGREAQIRLCHGVRCTALFRGVVAADGTFGADVVVQPMFQDRDGLDVVCEGQCVLRVGGIGLEQASAAPEPADIPVLFGTPGTVPIAMPDPTVPAGDVITSVVEPEKTVPATTVLETVPATAAPTSGG
ncbi:MAG: hypothetical protein ABW195_19480 [Ilumatobacteraceae bacterium]